MKKLMMTVVALCVGLIPAWSDEKPMPPPDKPQVEVAFVLDTTGSMSGLIAAAKTKIWSIATILATTDPAPDIKMGLVGYRDRGDDYVTRVSPLTDDLDAVYQDLLAFAANGGGDTPESVNQALDEAVTKLSWSKDKNAYRVIYLVGDAPPHMNYKQDVKYQTTCQLAARQGIIINTIQCGTMATTQPIWQEIASLAEGQYFRVQQSGGAIVSKTPFDEEIARLSKELDGTRLYYGTGKVRTRQQSKLKREKAIYEASETEALAQRATFNAKDSGKANFLGEQELVSSISSGTLDLGDVKTKELPSQMQTMSPEQRKVYIETMASKRQALQEQIAELSAKRQAHIADQLKLQNASVVKDSLDAALFNSIRDQAAKQGINYAKEAITY